MMKRIVIATLLLSCLLYVGCATHRGEAPTTLPPVIRFEAKEQAPAQTVPTLSEAALKKAQYQIDIGTQPKITAYFDKEDIFNVISIIKTNMETQGFSIDLIPAGNVSGDVSCNLKDTPLELALNRICFSGGFAWKKVVEPNDNYYYIIGSTTPGDPSALALIVSEKITTHRPAQQVYEMLRNPSYQAYVSVVTDLKNGPVGNEYTSRMGTGINQYTPLIFEPSQDSHELIVTGPQEVVDQIRQVIKTVIDPPLKQIVIQVLFTETQFDKSHRIGVDWSKGLDMNVNGSGTIAKGLAFGWESNIMGELLSNIQAMVRKGQLDLKDFPQIVTREGSLAVINMQTQQWIRLDEPRSLKGDSYYFRAETETFTYGTILMVRPSIADNGDVVLELAVEVDDVAGKNSDGLPIITKRSVNNEVKIKSGETIIIGGLYRELLKSDKTGVAGLSKLPIIDIPMSMRTKDNETKELTVFITAKVLEPVGTETAGETPLTKGAVQTQVQVIEKEKLIEKKILVPMADPEEWEKAIERGQKDE